MADHDINWHIENRVIFARPYGHHTLDSVQRFGNAITDFLDAGKMPIHLVIDDTDVQSAPRNLNKLLRTMAFAWHPFIGYVVMIGQPHSTQRLLTDSLARIAPIKCQRFVTLAQAMVFLLAVDVSIKYEEGV